MSKTLSLYIVQFLSVFHYLLPCSRMIIINKVNLYTQHLQDLGVKKKTRGSRERGCLFDSHIIIIYYIYIYTYSRGVGAAIHENAPRPLSFFSMDIFFFSLSLVVGEVKRGLENGARSISVGHRWKFCPLSPTHEG